MALLGVCVGWVWVWKLDHHHDAESPGGWLAEVLNLAPFSFFYIVLLGFQRLVSVQFRPIGLSVTPKSFYRRRVCIGLQLKLHIVL